MMPFRRIVCFAILLPLSIGSAQAENWNAWRGPRGDGTSLETAVPQKWDGKTGDNIAWKVELPGWSHSSPIVWEDRIFVTACEEKDKARVLMCLDRRDGKLLWKETVLTAPLEKKHGLNSYASGTPATDGKTVFVTFLEPDHESARERTPGNIVVAAYDFSGKQKWLVRPGRFASNHGFSSNPVLFKDMLIVNGDHDGPAYLVALDQATGAERWRVSRENKTRSYCTPIIRTIEGREQLILSGSKCVTSYDPNTGKLHWIIQGPTEQFVASMVFNGKLLFMTGGFPERHFLAIRPDGTGDVTETAIAWRSRKSAAYVPSPIAVGDYFLAAADEGVGTCFQADTGETLWTARMGKHYSASLTTAGGLVYFLADDGVMKVVRPGKKLDLVAENPLGEYIYSSPAISQGNIFLRGEKHLYCIGPKPTAGK